jgi:hypothetical protein
MAAGAIHLSVFPGQMEGDCAMVEFMSICVDTIVTAQTFFTIRLEMGLHEIGFDHEVAIRTDLLVKLDKTGYVTGFTNKSRTIRLLLVGG